MQLSAIAFSTILCGHLKAPMSTVHQCTTEKEQTELDKALCTDPTCGWGGHANYKRSMGETCIFPFKYQGVTYNSCSLVDHYRPWCPTKVNDAHEVVEYSGNWGNCATDCFEDAKAAKVSFLCSEIPTCCAVGFGPKDVYTPSAATQSTHIIGVDSPENRDAVIADVSALDADNRVNPNVQEFSMLKTLFIADLNPVEVGFLMNDTRVLFVECNGIASAQESGGIDGGVDVGIHVSVTPNPPRGPR